MDLFLEFDNVANDIEISFPDDEYGFYIGIILEFYSYMHKNICYKIPIYALNNFLSQVKSLEE